MWAWTTSTTFQNTVATISLLQQLMVPPCVHPAQHCPNCLLDASRLLSNEHHRLSCLIKVLHFCPSSPTSVTIIPLRALAPLPQRLRPKAQVSWFSFLPLPPDRTDSISKSCHLFSRIPCAGLSVHLSGSYSSPWLTGAVQ